MSIKVKYFASLADRIGRSEECMEWCPTMTVRQVWQTNTADSVIPANVFAAINLEYAGLDDEVQDGDEVAFFPPVTGG